MSPQRLYNTALADFTAGQWALCIEGFNTYLRGFPRTDHADDAQWYVGECYQQDGKFTEAIDAYNRVIANYPKGDRVPDAYYKRGIAFSAMGQTDRARESFEALMKTSRTTTWRGWPSSRSTGSTAANRAARTAPEHVPSKVT